MRSSLITSNLLQDVRFALRFLRHNPAFAALTIGTLGLGLGATTTVFSWINTVLLQPIPGVVDAHQLAALETLAADGSRRSPSTHPDFRDFQRELTLTSGVAATHVAFFTVGPVERPRRVIGQVVSANFFTVLGVRPALGRFFNPEEDRDDFGAFPFAVISHRLWRSAFGADPQVVGRLARINGRQLTILGVAPEDFHGTFGGAYFDVWVPLSLATQMGALNTWAAADRNARFLDLIVRLKPGVSLPQVRAQAQGTAARIAAAFPDTHRGISAILVPIREASQGLQHTLGRALLILMVVCVLVLLIACANVANLLMARSIARQREFGVRLALGAGRWRLVRLVLVEVSLLALAGASVGLFLTQWCGDLLARVLPAMDSSVRTAIEPLLRPTPDPAVLGFCLLAALAAAAFSVAVPAVFAGQIDLNETLKQGGRGRTSRAQPHRARVLLVVGEVALTAVALIGAGLAVRLYQKYSALHPGFDAQDVLVAQLHLSTNGYGLQQEKQFCRGLRLRLESTPGIQSVASADSVPLSMLSPSAERVQVDGSVLDRQGVFSVYRSIVSPGFFDLMRIPLLAGRDFTALDDEKAPRVIIVNQTFARKYFPGADPLGRAVRVSGKSSTIVGVVQDSKYRSQPEGPVPFFYGPFSQIFYSGHHNFLYIRGSRGLEVVRAALRRVSAGTDPAIGLNQTLSLSDHMQAGLFAERVAAGLLSLLAVLSLILASVGLYSVMAYAVSEQTHEIGIRMALGARPNHVLLRVIGQGLAMAALGLLAGLAAALALGRILATAIEPAFSLTDPAVFAATGLTVLLITLLATLIPARRAIRVDPMTALRTG